MSFSDAFRMLLGRMEQGLPHPCPSPHAQPPLYRSKSINSLMNDGFPTRQLSLGPELRACKNWGALERFW